MAMPDRADVSCAGEMRRLGTFVTLGNRREPFQRLVDEVGRIALHLPQPVLLQSGHTPCERSGLKAVPFMPMQDFVSCIETAEIVIAQAGAGTILHAIQCGKVPVVVPRSFSYGESIDDHQIELARELASGCRVIVVEHIHQLLDASAQSRRRQAEGTHYEPNARLLELVHQAIRRSTRGWRRRERRTEG